MSPVPENLPASAARPAEQEAPKELSRRGALGLGLRLAAAVTAVLTGCTPPESFAAANNTQGEESSAEVADELQEQINEAAGEVSGVVQVTEEAVSSTEPPTAEPSQVPTKEATPTPEASATPEPAHPSGLALGEAKEPVILEAETLGEREVLGDLQMVEARIESVDNENPDLWVRLYTNFDPEVLELEAINPEDFALALEYTEGAQGRVTGADENTPVEVFVLEIDSVSEPQIEDVLHQTGRFQETLTNPGTVRRWYDRADETAPFVYAFNEAVLRSNLEAAERGLERYGLQEMQHYNLSTEIFILFMHDHYFRQGMSLQQVVSKVFQAKYDTSNPESAIEQSWLPGEEERTDETNPYHGAFKPIRFRLFSE